MRDPLPSMPVTRYRRGGIEGGEDTVAAELPLSLTVNGDLWLTLMCTPLQQEALAIGFLYNEGIIESMDEIADVRLCAHGDNVDIWLTHAAERPASWRRTSGCTGGVTAADLAARTDPDLIRPTGPPLPPGRVAHLMRTLFASQEIYRESGGVHTSALSDGERVVAAAEDIGRHNTLDKIAGWCLLHNCWPDHRILLTTGRISSEMLQKAARMRVSIVISRTAPTSLSIQMAEAWGITLIGYARRDRFNIYTHPERIAVPQSRTNIAPQSEK